MELITRLPDEELKRLTGILDEERSNEAYVRHQNTAEEMQILFGRNHLRPSDDDISDPAVREFLAGEEIVLIVPMREKGPVIRPLLSVVTKLMRPQQIFVVDGGSDEEARGEVVRHQAVLVDASRVLDLLDWKRLLPILCLDKRPEGKGVAVLAGYLLQYLLAEYKGDRPSWICQHDSEIAEYRRYRGLEYLAWGAKIRTGTHYVKMAKTGRGNESCMTARSLLRSLAKLQNDAGVKKRMDDLFMKLGPHKWMLTGEFMLEWSLAMTRPFATGFLEETLISSFAEDKGAMMERRTIHVDNSNPRLDAPNTVRKEAIMQFSISSFIMELAHERVPVGDWTIEDIERINHSRMSEPLGAAWIPADDRPTQFEEIENDRIIPSITMLHEGGFINEDAAWPLIRTFLT